MTKNIVRMCSLALGAVLGLWGCEPDHLENFTDVVPETPTDNQTRYRGQFTSVVDGETVRDTICVVDYIKARNSQTGDSLLMYYFKLSDTASVIRQLTLTSIAFLNQEISMRGGRRSVDALVDADSTLWRPMVASDLNGSVSSSRLTFSVLIDGTFHVAFDGENAVHTE